MFSFIYTRMYTYSMSNYHSERCHIMCLCHNGLFMWLSGSLKEKSGSSQAQCRASQSASALFLEFMKSSQIFRPFSTLGHVIYQMNGPLFWTVEPATVYDATRQVSTQFCFSLQRTNFSWAICIPLGNGMSEA